MVTYEKSGLEIVTRNGVTIGIRNNGGFLLFFPSISKYTDDEDERYRNEKSQQAHLADLLLAALTDNKPS